MNKQKRIVNQDLLDYIKTLPCICCRTVPSDPDHISTKGSGGGDTSDNVWPLCRVHHTERHAKGILHMTTKYEACRDWLVLAHRYDVLERVENRKEFL